MYIIYIFNYALYLHCRVAVDLTLLAVRRMIKLCRPFKNLEVGVFDSLIMNRTVHESSVNYYCSLSSVTYY